ncbi:hypothetical protein CAOG_08329 [Capsaspora owczarzaki ATCC 30864]|nr:hypothetical protein CAOG_08329 [Capsaspora owczarzaki ATCC 30864]|eukprot:XP_004341195.1 hypothetical protein CAOG_08329 [Capsaspora owczarzaki ATCC 30864]
MFEIILTSALKCREDLDEFFHLHEHLTTIPDPWTSSTKVRNALVRQYEVTTEAIGRTASVEQRALFLQQLAVLTDLLLTSYWGELEFLEFHGPEYEERHVAVFNTFVECRPRFIDPFVKHNDTAMAFALAEKYKHFQLLIQMCEDMDAPAQLDTYVRQFEPDGFAQELFQWYLDHGKAAKLLKSPRSRDAALGEFLKTHPELSWLHDIRTDNYAQAAMTLRDLAKNETALFQKRKTLLSLWKMALACADESNPEDSEDVWQFMWFMQVQELLVSDAKYAPLVAGFGNNGVNLETDYLEPLRLIDAFIGQYNPIPDAIDLALAMETYARSMPSRSDEENTSLLLDICVRSILKNDWSAVINASKQSPTDAELLQILNATAFFSLASLFDSQELLYSMNITLPDIVLLANDSRLGILRGNTELIRLLQTTAGMTSRSM